MGNCLALNQSYLDVKEKNKNKNKNKKRNKIRVLNRKYLCCCNGRNKEVVKIYNDIRMQDLEI